MLLTNEISILEVESVQLIASLLGIHHVFINDEGRSLCIVGDSLADLSMI
jgi:hypothetical protein